MQSLTTAPPRAPRGEPAGRRVRPRPLVVATFVAAVVGLFAGYLRMSRTVSANADGASNALQAWDMLHGNPLLPGWTVTDVSFYTTELVQYMLVELVYGYDAGTIHVAAAMTYVLAFFLAAVVAKGHATGRAAAVRIGVVAAIMLLPAPLTGYIVLLGSPDHFGTSVPLLVTWLVLDRAAVDHSGSARLMSRNDSEQSPRWLPVAVAVLLAWGTVADPLVMYVGALPLAVVSLLRLAHDRRWHGDDARLLLASAASVALAEAFLAAVRMAGGFHVHQPITEFAPIERIGKHVWLAIKSLAVIFGCYFPDLNGPAEVALGVLHLGGALTVGGAIVVVVAQAVRGRGDRVTQVLALAILVNLGAFVASTLPVDLLTTRQLVAVLPLGAALAGRAVGGSLAGRAVTKLAQRGLLPVLTALLLAYSGAFVVRSTAPVTPTVGRDVGEWLVTHDLTYGLGSYWGANIITLSTSGRVHVVPVTGEDRIMGYRWESREDWYDAARHDARFILIDLENPAYGTVKAAATQFGPPAERHDFGRFAVLVYGHNLLVGLPAYCVPEVVPSMADCPD